MKTGYIPLPSSGPEEVMNHASDTDGAGQIQNVNGWCFVTQNRLMPVSHE